MLQLKRAKNFIEKEGFINARMELPEIVNTSEGYESVLLKFGSDDVID